MSPTYHGGSSLQHTTRRYTMDRTSCSQVNPMQSSTAAREEREEGEEKRAGEPDPTLQTDNKGTGDDGSQNRSWEAKGTKRTAIVTALPTRFRQKRKGNPADIDM